MLYRAKRSRRRRVDGDAKLRQLLTVTLLFGSIAACREAGFTGGDSDGSSSSPKASQDAGPSPDGSNPDGPPGGDDAGDVEGGKGGSPDDPGNPNPSTDEPNATTDEAAACAKPDTPPLTFPPGFLDCMNQGLVYNFSTQGCATLPKATAFECAFDPLIAAIDALEVKPEEYVTLARAESEGSRLIACGMSSDGETIIYQRWKPMLTESGACDTDVRSKNVVTGCYKYDPNGRSPSPDEMREFVLGCLNEG